MSFETVPKGKREIICGDSIEWLSKIPDGGLPEGYCGFTSLPDISELPTMFFGTMTAEYKEWFVNAAALFMSKLPNQSYAIYLQSDLRVMDSEGKTTEWIDKSYLCSLAAERAGCKLMWHKLVYTDKTCTKRSTGRPTYSHLLCYAKSANNAVKVVSKTSIKRDGKNKKKGDGLSDSSLSLSPTFELSYRPALFAVPDIFYRGEMLWPKGIGLDCCYVGIMFLKQIAEAKCVIDPFAGQGTVLSMANAVGMDAVGIELSPKRCKKAANLIMTPEHLDLISPNLRSIALEIVEERSRQWQSKQQLKLQQQLEDTLKVTDPQLLDQTIAKDVDDVK